MGIRFHLFYGMMSLNNLPPMLYFKETEGIVSIHFDILLSSMYFRVFICQQKGRR